MPEKKNGSANNGKSGLFTTQNTLLASAMRASLNEIYIFDARTLKFRFVNETALQNTGYTAQEIAGLTTKDISADFSRTTFSKMIDRLLEAKKPSKTFITSHKRKDGTVYPVETHLELVKQSGEKFFLSVSNDISERIAAEEKLRESEEQLRGVLHASADAVIVTDDSENLVFWNKAAEKIFNCDLSEYKNRPVSFITPEKLRKERLAAFRALAENAGAQDLENRIESTAARAGGNEFPAEISMSATKLKNRVFFTSVIRDLSGRKQAEKILAQNESRLKAIFETAAVGIALWDIESFVINANSTLEHLLGYTAGSLRHISKKELFHPDDINKLSELFSQLINNKKQHFRLETRCVKTDATPVWVRMFSSLVKAENGQPLYIVSVIEDISEQRKLENDYRNLFNQTLDGFALHEIITNEQGLPVDYRFLSVNPAFETMTGLNAEKITGKTLKEVIPAAEDKWVKIYGEVALTGKSKRFDSYSKELNKHYEVLAFRPAPGQFACVMQDITKKKLYEEESARMQKIELLEVLAGGIAHDFNNMLTGIMANISVLREKTGTTGENSAILSETSEALDKAKALTLQLLTFSKGGKSEKKLINTKKLLTETAGFALRGSNCSCNFTIPENLPCINGDEGQLAQTIQNMVLNAAQAMPHGGIIEAKAENITVNEISRLPLNKGEYIRLSFIDTGCGILRGNIGKIFEPYFTTKEHGHGLGLPMCYSIVKNHGGHITVHSEENKGTEFSIYLPAAKSESFQEQKPKIEVIKGCGKILVMDDDQIVRKAIKRMLEALGYQALCVEEGTAAVEAYKASLAQDTPFLAVITDLTVPGGMGGKETLEKIKQLDPNAKVIVSSGYSEDALVSEYSKYGFAAALSKPYKFEELSLTLNNLLTNKEPL